MLASIEELAIAPGANRGNVSWLKENDTLVTCAGQLFAVFSHHPPSCDQNFDSSTNQICCYLMLAQLSGSEISAVCKNSRFRQHGC